MTHTVTREELDYARSKAAEYLTDNGCMEITLEELHAIAMLVCIERQKAEDAREDGS